MNKNTLSNPVRSIAFFLTAVILACTFGFTVDGWQANLDEEKDNSASNLPEDTPGEEAGENNTNAPDKELPPENEEPEIYIPEYINRITGLETTAQLASTQCLAFVMNASLPAYGISNAELVCEVPTENGGNRLVAFISRIDNLWKIGSITNTRGYISNVVKYFSAAMVSCGSDDSISYTGCDLSGMHLDLSQKTGYHYTEYMSNVYTNPDLLTGGLDNAGIGKEPSISSPLPYNHTDFGEENVVYSDATASSVRIEHSFDSVSELRFDESSGCYTLYKNGAAITDSLNGNSVNFTNCFVLFADSVTYDNSSCNQMVMDTIGDGSGFYFTGGSYTEIKWTATSGGIMTFYSPDGNKLTVNRGTNYISFVKSSLTDKITIQ